MHPGPALLDLLEPLPHGPPSLPLTAGGANPIEVASVEDSATGRKITIDTGADQDTATVATVNVPRRGSGGSRGRRGGPIGGRITVAAPLTHAHAGGARVAGTGITLASPLARAHPAGAPVANGAPTPAAPDPKYR